MIFVSANYLRHISQMNKLLITFSEEEFNAGFGSHTPMLLGQARVLRYYPNFGRYGLKNHIRFNLLTVSLH